MLNPMIQNALDLSLHCRLKEWHITEGGETLFIPAPSPVEDVRNPAKHEDRRDQLLVGPYCTEIKGGIHRGGLPSGGGFRGKIREFSKESRTRLMKKLSNYYDHVSHWQHLTFADEIFDFCSFDNVVEKSSYKLKLLSEWYKRQSFPCSVIWRREYEPRKSGSRKGQLLPHFHLLFVSEKKLTELQVRVMSLRIATAWWRINKGPHKMLKVNTHASSWAKIQDPIHASRYVSKYIAKTTGDIFPEGASLGRFWGMIQKDTLPEILIDEIHLPNRLSLIYRRYLRKLAKGKGYAKFLRYKDGNKDQIGSGYLFAKRKTILSLLNYAMKKGGYGDGVQLMFRSSAEDFGPFEEF